jgi:nucleoside-diphosphate-sugar epimerase
VVFAAGLTTASGHGDWKDYLDANVGVTLNLIKACRQAGVKRLIYLGSQAAHPSAEGRYGVSKQLGELAVEACDLDWLLLKPGQVIGTRGLVNTLYGLSNLLPFFPVLGGTPANLELVGVDEIAAYVQAALEHPAQHTQRTVQLGSSRRLSFDALLELLWTSKGRRPPLVLKLPRWFFALAVKAAAIIGIRVPLTSQVLDGIYTTLPECSYGRACDEEPEVVLARYL